ncbi:hypothetical protein E5288_WYG001744 [Bos mutus]|uniref:Uncharacterized protein n=1 Tax=Bos mutus TaxID=72004 RepID=A0A6B0RUM8_9CETA|nr:hypothetical protein [Bos mutus]
MGAPPSGSRGGAAPFPAAREARVLAVSAQSRRKGPLDPDQLNYGYENRPVSPRIFNPSLRFAYSQKEQYDDHEKKKDLVGLPGSLTSTVIDAAKNVSAKPNSGKGKMLT